MTERFYQSSCGTIHDWGNAESVRKAPQLVFLPGLTADHRLFDKQIESFEGQYPVFVWDAPGHADSWPFELRFSLRDKACWLNELLEREGFREPVLVGQSMGGCVAQMFTQLFMELVHQWAAWTYPYLGGDEKLMHRRRTPSPSWNRRC